MCALKLLVYILFFLNKFKITGFYHFVVVNNCINDVEVNQEKMREGVGHAVCRFCSSKAKSMPSPISLGLVLPVASVVLVLLRDQDPNKDYTHHYQSTWVAD